jgi:hypothetical protein
VTDRLYIVSIRIEDKRTVIIRVAPAGHCPSRPPQRRAVECINRRPILRRDRDVHRLFQLPLSADPEIGLAAAAETGSGLSSLLRSCLYDQCVAKRRQCTSEIIWDNGHDKKSLGRWSPMPCTTCGAEMILINVVQEHAMAMRGFEHHSLPRRATLGLPEAWSGERHSDYARASGPTYCASFNSAG